MKWILFFLLLVVMSVGMNGNTARDDIEWAVRRERRMIAEAKRRMA